MYLPIAATLFKTACIPLSIISCNNSIWSLFHKYARDLSPKRVQLKKFQNIFLSDKKKVNL